MAQESASVSIFFFLGGGGLSTLERGSWVLGMCVLLTE